MKHTIYKRFASLCAAVACAGIIGGCSFEDINRPLGALSKEDLQTDNLIGSSMLSTLIAWSFPQQENRYQHTQDLIGNYYGRYLATLKDEFNTSKTTTYNAPDSWITWPYNNSWPKISGAMKELENAMGKEDASYHLAQIIRAHALLQFTDTYGSFPFGGATPQDFASQEAVYKAIISELNTATEYFNKLLAASPNLVIYEKIDNVYKGNVGQWVKFANSLKLRMAIRMSKVAPEMAKEVALKAIQDGVIESNADNCLCYYKPAGLYKTSVEWKNSGMSAEMESYLSGYNDPRMEKYFSPAKEPQANRPYAGVPVGSYIEKMEHAGKIYALANVTESTPSIWFTAAEVAFLKAECALLGWPVGATPKEWYEKGVRLSFEQWGASGADAYLQNNTNTPAAYTKVATGYGKSVPAPTDITIAWDDNATQQQKMERLMVQKWIALFPLGMEAWSEIRRTGYPIIFGPAQPTPGYTIKTANRVPYGKQEATKNPKSYAQMESLLDGPDDYTTRMWWQQ